MEKYLCFFLIPFLLDFINCDYILNIQNQCFEFTLEENDAANEFKSRLPLSISMTLSGTESKLSLGYSENNFWNKSYTPSVIQNFESGIIGAVYTNSIYIKFYSGEEFETNFGKIKDPNKVIIPLILDTEEDNIFIAFMVGSCCGSKTCSENQYCTKDGNCLSLEKCEIGVFLPDGFCKCDYNICSKNQVCNGTDCSNVTNCTVNSPASNPMCICQDGICEEGKICTSYGSCIEPPTNIPTTIQATVPAEVLTTEPSAMSTDLPAETETSSEVTGDSNKEIENTSEEIVFESQDKEKTSEITGTISDEKGTTTEESVNTNEGESDVSERTEAQSDEIGNTNQGTETTNQEIGATSSEIGITNQETGTAKEIKGTISEEIGNTGEGDSSISQGTTTQSEVESDTNEETAITNEYRSRTNEETRTTNEETATTIEEKSTTNEEKSTTNEETRSTNLETGSTSKEIRSTNLETKSTREEAKTSNEETKITNEETSIINEETSSTNEETATTNEETATTNKETAITNKETPTTDEETSTINEETKTTNEENPESIGSTNEINSEYSTSVTDDINEKTNTIYSKESDSSIVDAKEATTTRMEIEKPTIETEKPTIPKIETEKPTTPKMETEKPTIPQIETEKPTTPKIETEKPTTPKIETEKPTIPKIETEKPTTPKIETERPSTSQIETKKPTTPKIETEKPTTPTIETEKPTSPKIETEKPIIQKVSPKTEEITSQEKTLVILVGLSHVKLEEKIITFFIYFGLYEIYAGAKRVKFPIEFSSRRLLRLLETQEAECVLVESDSKGDKYTYSCEAQVQSTQNIKSIKIYNQFEFSSENNSISASYSPFIEQYLDNIQEIGNKFVSLLNSTLYTLEYPKISQGENQNFNISGIINDPKPKFGKVDLNLSVSVEYENKAEEKQLECNIIDITGNNYTLSRIGIKNTNFSLLNAMSVIDDEILIIHFDENENNTILYYSDENKNLFTRGFRNSKSGKIGAGGIVAIIFACAAIIAALILTYLCCKKDKAGEIENKESTILNLKN